MTIYNLNIDMVNSSLAYFQAEKYIYGSSRLGMLKDSVNVLGSAYTNTDTSNFIHTLGNKRYELSNHLGNVLTVITDKPIPHNNGGTVDYWLADIKSSQDYSPFGVILNGRSFGDTSYSRGFQGQLRDDEVSGKGNSYTAEFWQYDSRLGRRWNLDPRPNSAISPYAAFANNPIFYNDPYGDTVKFASDQAGELYNDYKAEVQKRFDNAKNEKDKATYGGILKELSGLEKSTDVFRIRTDGDFAPETEPSDNDGGNIAFNKKTLEIDINIKLNTELYSPIQKISHELKHADQFVNCKLNLTINGGGGYAYDQTDEREAYARQNLFAPDVISDYIDPYEAASTYKNIPQEAISVSSTGHYSTDGIDIPSENTQSINYRYGMSGKLPFRSINAGDIPAYKAGLKNAIKR